MGACRILGSIYASKIAANLHITSRGHGYREYLERIHLFVIQENSTASIDSHSHTDHSCTSTNSHCLSTHMTWRFVLVLNFTHRIDELSFGKFYPNAINPLDNSIEVSNSRKLTCRINIWQGKTKNTGIDFEAFQYFLSVVSMHMDQLGIILTDGWNFIRYQLHTLAGKRMSSLPTSMQWQILARQLLMIDQRIWCLVYSSNTTLNLYQFKYQSHDNPSPTLLFDCAVSLVVL